MLKKNFLQIETKCLNKFALVFLVFGFFLRNDNRDCVVTSGDCQTEINDQNKCTCKLFVSRVRVFNILSDFFFLCQ